MAMRWVFGDGHIKAAPDDALDEALAFLELEDREAQEAREHLLELVALAGLELPVCPGFSAEPTSNTG